MDLLQLYYASRAAEDLGEEGLAAILTTARRKNGALGLTGMLLHGDGRFLQVLEGPPDAVRSLYDLIEGDPRHHDCHVMWERHVAKREFPDWTMGSAPMSRDGLSKLEGFVDFFADDFDTKAFASSGSPARFLLLAFRNADHGG